MTFDPITHRLQSASASIALSDAAQAKHLSSIADALSISAPTPQPIRARRKLVAALVSAAMLTPTGLAVAADDALPGEALYSIKQVSEKVLVLVDPEIIARHRIEELEASASEVNEELSEGARDALTRFAGDHSLWDRFHAVRSSTGDIEPPPTEAPGVAPIVEVDNDDASSDGRDQHPARTPGSIVDDDTSSEIGTTEGEHGDEQQETTTGPDAGIDDGSEDSESSDDSSD